MQKVLAKKLQNVALNMESYKLLTRDLKELSKLAVTDNTSLTAVLNIEWLEGFKTTNGAKGSLHKVKAKLLSGFIHLEEAGLVIDTRFSLLSCPPSNLFLVFTKDTHTVKIEFSSQGELCLWRRNLERFTIQASYAEDYIVGDLIAKGGRSKLFNFTKISNLVESTSKAVVGKVFPKYHKTEVSVVNEIEILWGVLGLPQVPTIRGIFETENQFIILMDKVAGENLTTILKKTKGLLDIRAVKLIMRGTLKSLCRLHSLGIVHRNLQPDNLIIGDLEHVTIVDFGLAGFTSTIAFESQFTGTTGFVPPEAIHWKGGVRFGPAFDIFSLGVVLHILLLGYSPYESVSPTQVVKLTTEGINLKKTIKSLDHEVQQLLLSMLNPDPYQRPSAFECVEHQFFSQPTESPEQICIVIHRAESPEKIIPSEEVKAKPKDLVFDEPDIPDIYDLEPEDNMENHIKRLSIGSTKPSLSTRNSMSNPDQTTRSNFYDTTYAGSTDSKTSILNLAECENVQRQPLESNLHMKEPRSVREISIPSQCTAEGKPSSKTIHISKPKLLRDLTLGMEHKQ